jgi:hypothetical protein
MRWIAGKIDVASWSATLSVETDVVQLFPDHHHHDGISGSRSDPATTVSRDLTICQMPTSPTKKELKRLLFEAVRSYMLEDPKIGGGRAEEWAVSTRVAIHLARTPDAKAWERSTRKIVVDAEYSQAGLCGDPKWSRLLQRGMKPDLIVHRRGLKGSKHNWIACEIKLHTSCGVPTVNVIDRIKLQSMKQQYGYRMAIWLSIPRTNDGDVAYYTEINNNGQHRPLKPLP